MSSLEERMQILTMIRNVSNYFEKAKDDLCAPYNFSSAQAKILLDLNEHGPSMVTAICKRLGKTTNTLSPMLQRLEKSGYIKRAVNEGDRRVNYISLSSKGSAIMKDYLADAGKYSWPIFDRVSDEDFRHIYDSLIRMTKILAMEEVENEE